MAVPELMRILLDEAHDRWEHAGFTRRTLAYTNHTLLPEALEKWPLEWFEAMLPRHLEIILEINRRLIEVVRNRFQETRNGWHVCQPCRRGNAAQNPDGQSGYCRISQYQWGGRHPFQVACTMTVKDHELYPERFNNKTNGVTPRRWLLLANPALSHAITDAIGDGWITDLDELSKLKNWSTTSRFKTHFAKPSARRS